MDKSAKTLRKILDAATDNDYKAAIQALEEYAKFRSVQFSEWQDNTKSPTLHLDWDSTDELYEIFREYNP